ncbi:MAG TPA: hypothetical protein VHP83_01215 [Aggregatilineaceae bacterium]|nr:hypothetical protein [Aggregatilineaceae bacterium]
MSNRSIYLTLLLIPVVLMGVGLWGIITYAEPATATLSIPARAEGSLDTANPEALYEIPANAGQVFSVFVVVTARDLELDIMLLDPAGNVVAEDTPVAAGASVYAIEAVTPTEYGTYRLIVTRVGDTSGDYIVEIAPVQAEMIMDVP